MLNPRIRFLSAALAFVVTALPASALRTAGAQPRKSKTRTSQADDVSIEFETKQLKKGSSEAADLKAILDAAATLTVKRPFGYGRSSLPAGAYPVKIERTDEKKWYFVVGERPPEERKTDDTTAGRSGPQAMGIAGKLARRTSEEETDEPEEKKSTRNRTEKNSKKEKEKEKEDSEEAEEAKKPATEKGWLRARVRFSKAAKPSSEVIFELRSVDRGARFQLSVQAGASLGKASFRFVADEDDAK